MHLLAGGNIILPVMHRAIAWLRHQCGHSFEKPRRFREDDNESRVRVAAVIELAV